MNNIWVIAVKEWRQFFVSVLAYVCGAALLLFGGYFFGVFMRAFNEFCLQASGFVGQPEFEYMTEHLNINDVVVRNFFGSVTVIFLIVVPAVTMRLFAEEKRAGTDELLFTSPISDWHLVGGKYLGGLLAVLTPLALTLSYTGFLAMHAAPDWGPVWTGYAGLAFLVAAYVAVGLAASAATRSQLVAYILAFSVLLFLHIIGWAAELSSYETGQVLRALSSMEHFENFSKGVVEIRDIVYFLSVAAFGLVLTHQLVAARRWKG
ncbi:MAG: ABC transporter permease subunit [Acidobacteriota bacterium]|nr:MAG: ABC transporter permease subunit [Acidobacteriota bacterium]